MDGDKKVGWAALVIRVLRAILRRVFGRKKETPPPIENK